MPIPLLLLKPALKLAKRVKFKSQPTEQPKQLPQYSTALKSNVIPLTLTLGPYSFHSQIEKQFDSETSAAVRDVYIPTFLRFWRSLEEHTGHRWKCTSFIRDAPSHTVAQAIDLAPDFTPEAERSYAVARMSDPVLYKRVPLIRALQQMVNTDYTNQAVVNGTRIGLGVYIESDHLHVQIVDASKSRYPTHIFKWKDPKPIYSDTYQRMKLPLFS